MKASSVSYILPPNNYGVVTKILSRSAQPDENALLWLKKNGVTDVVNFRTMFDPRISFNEEQAVRDLSMNYHNIPSVTAAPKPQLIRQFLELMENIKNGTGKVHVHCKAGADRTGMYVFIYKELNNLGNRKANIDEWLQFGHHKDLFPNLIPWACKFVNKIKKG